jgi:hypothetical protein
MHEIDLTDEVDRWRYVCPHGHRTWEPWNGHFWCQRCAARPNVDPEFEKLYDKRDDRDLHREDVRLLTGDPSQRRGRA